MIFTLHGIMPAFQWFIAVTLGKAEAEHDRRSMNIYKDIKASQYRHNLIKNFVSVPNWIRP